MTRQLSLVASFVLCVSCAQQGIERQRLKAELKREILAELEAGTETGEKGPEAVDADHALTERPTPDPAGNVTGRVLLGERGLPGCRVRLIRLEGGGGLSGWFSRPRETSVLETTTGGDGTYRFDDVPPGAYRLKWRPEGETGWIRRLSADPDLVVEGGRSASAGDFRAGRPLLDG